MNTFTPSPYSRKCLPAALHLPSILGVYTPLSLVRGAGHILLAILSGFTYNIMASGFIFFIVGLLPLSFIIAFCGLELAICMIQAQVFVVLTASYIKDALDLHGDGSNKKVGAYSNHRFLEQKRRKVGRVKFLSHRKNSSTITVTKISGSDKDLTITNQKLHN